MLLAVASRAGDPERYRLPSVARAGPRSSAYPPVPGGLAGPMRSLLPLEPNPGLDRSSWTVTWRRNGREADRDGFRRFAQDTSVLLLRTAYLLLGDRGLAEDAVQISLMRTYQHWRKSSANPVAYSRTVLINLCRDQQRKFRRMREVPTESSFFDRRLQLAPTDSVLDRHRLGAALRTLSDEQRAVLVLRFFLDMSVSETARVLGIAEGTVKSTTSRALDRLRLTMAPQDSEVRDVE